MKVYIANRLPRSDPELEELVELVARETVWAGHKPFIAYREIIQMGFSEGKSFMPFVRQNIHDSDLLIIIYDVELRGGLVEEGIAYADGIPIWLMHKAGEQVSNTARGCAMQVIPYESLGELKRQISTLYQKNL